MSMIERTRVKCDAKGCEKRTYVPVRMDQEKMMRARLEAKNWALISIGELRRALCPEHVVVAESLFAVQFLPKRAATTSQLGEGWLSLVGATMTAGTGV